MLNNFNRAICHTEIMCYIYFIFNRQIARLMDKNFKRTILIDLDGVLNTYTGNFDKNYIPPIKFGAKKFLIELSREFKIKLFTTRNKELAVQWIFDEGLENIISDVTNTKDLNYLLIDDRCICFDGNYANLKTQIKNFKPWYK